jgi:hypothetical protein
VQLPLQVEYKHTNPLATENVVFGRGCSQDRTGARKDAGGRRRDVTMMHTAGLKRNQKTEPPFPHWTDHLICPRDPPAPCTCLGIRRRSLQILITILQSDNFRHVRIVHHWHNMLLLVGPDIEVPMIEKYVLIMYYVQSKVAGSTVSTDLFISVES